jgi:hypothetical protein
MTLSLLTRYPLLRELTGRCPQSHLLEVDRRRLPLLAAFYVVAELLPLS